MEIKLPMLYENIIKFILKIQTISLIIIGLCLVIIFLILKHIKDYFIRELFKKHLYLYFNNLNQCHYF